ncbi:PBECR2 nuclease fold domain-containing protein [Campylobacter upsaliensis]|nr:PBECR2 nuclease fold domain-containing protein [Campylobacter upsaliensis]
MQKAVNVLKQFEESELLRHVFSDKKQELQQEYLKNALVIAELNGFDDVGLSKENELYFIKKDKDKEEKYLVNTGFLDNFWDLIENSKFEVAGGIAGGIKGFNSGKSAKGKVVKSILGAAAGSFGGGLMDAKIADMYLNRESDYKRNLEYALQAGLLSLAGDGVIIAAKPMVKGAIKGAKGVYNYAKERTPLGLFSTIPSQNINAANKIINEVFTPEMKEELKQAQKEFGGGVRAEDLANPIFEKLKQSFAKKYGQEDKKTKSVEKLAEIFNQNSLKNKQQEMLDLIRSDKDGNTLAYLLEVAKDDVKIQNNLKNMLNLASANVENNLKNLNINPREIKSILDEFEAGNKAAFKEVENQIAKLYNEDIKVVLDRAQYENIKKDFLENGVNLDEMTPFLRDLENNVFSKEGVSFAKLNNFRKNLNYYIFNKDKTPNFVNTLKKIAETSLKAEIDKGIDNIFKELPKAYESIKELYSTSLKDYAAMKELNESIKNLKLQDSAKSADEVVDSLIKYAKGQGEGGENNLQKIKAYLGEENNAFLEMQILNRLFKESVVENDRAKVRVFDSESFLNRVKELVGESELFKSKEAREFLELVEGFDKLYKNDAIIAKNLTQGTTSKLSTSIATSAEGAIKQKVVKGAFDPIFRLLPDGVLFGLFSKQIQGGALRYHLRKALSRSLNYDDFKLKLERELKRTHFNSNTSRLIDEFMDNLDKFNAEKEAKLARIREEAEAKRAEELKRQEAIKAAQENAYHTQEANLGQDILEAEVKEEFGENFEGFKGKEAVLKLLEEKRGQVKGAFYKEGLGEIDLVWGEITDLEKHKGYGLAHILDKHPEFDVFKIPQIIEQGEIQKTYNGYNVVTNDYIVGLNKGFKDKEGKVINDSNVWVVTSFEPQIKAKKEASSIASVTSNYNEPMPQKPLEDIIAQNSEKLPFEMQVLTEDKLNGDEVRHLANKIGEKTRTMAYFKDYLLKMDRDFHARAKDIIREYYKIEPFRKELENQWANVKEAYNKGEMSLKEFKFLSKYKDERDFLNQVAQTLWHQNDELVKNRGHSINEYGQIERGKGGNYYQNLALEYDGALKNLKKWFYYIQKANKQAQRFFNKKMKTTKDIIKEAKEQGESISSTPFTKEDNLSLNSKQSITQKAKIENTQDFKPFNDSVKDDKQAFLQFIKIMQDTKNGDFYPSENLQNALEKSGKKANENALLLFIKEYENKDTKLVELLKNIQETRIANKALSLIKYFTKARMMQSAIKAVPSDILKKYVNIDASQRMEVLSSLYSDFSNIMKEIALKGKKIPDPAALSEKGGAYLFNRQYRKILNIYEKIQENEELLRLLAHKNDYKTTIEIIQESKAKGLSVKQTKEAIEENKKQTTKLFDEVLNNPLKSETKPKSEDIIFTDTKGKEHTLTKEVQEQWLETFNLKSLNEAYTPKHSDEIKEALGGKEIKLQLGSLKKLIAQGREQYIPQIKEVLDSPEAILKDSDNAFLFAKHLKDDDYFVNVSVDKGEYLVSISNGIKETNNIKNKLDSGAEVIYQSPNANSNLQTLLQTSRYSANKIDEDIITQNETEKTFFERYPNLEDYDKKIWSEIDWGHSLTEKDVMYRDMLYIYYPDVGTLNRKLIDVIKNVRPLIGFDEQNKIIDKYFKKYHKMDITNKLKEKIYRYVHKNEGSIDEIGEFILNTQKELVAYMKNIIPQETRLSYEKIIEERGLLTIYKEKIEKANSLFKEANVKEEIKQIIDNGVKKGRDMQILGEENFTPEVVEYIHKNKAKAAIDKLEKDEAENLGFKYSDDVRLTIDSEAIQHTLKRHGAESDLVKNSGQIPVEYKDIAEYRNIVKNANESLRARDNAGNDIIVSYKQINGYAVVVEQIRKKNNELSFKTMFKQNGDYKNSKSYKETSALNQTLSIGYEPSANSFSKTDNESIAQNAKEQSHFNDIIQENEGGNQNAKQNQGNEFERAKRTMQDDTGRVFFKNELDKEKAHDTRGATGGSDIHSAGDELTASQILQESDTKISKRGSAGASGRGHTTGEENEKSIRMEDSVRSGGFSADDTHLRQNNTRPDDNERFNEGKAFKSIRPLHEKTTRGTRGLDNRNLPQQILNKKWSEALEKRGILSPLQNAKIEAKKEQAAKYTFTESANEKLILEDNYKALEALLNLEKYSKSGEDLLDGWDREYKKALANFKGFGKATNALLKLKDEDKAKWDNMLKDLSKTLGVKINIADLVQRSKDAY